MQLIADQTTVSWSEVNFDLAAAGACGRQPAARVMLTESFFSRLAVAFAIGPKRRGTSERYSDWKLVANLFGRKNKRTSASAVWGGFCGPADEVGAARPGFGSHGAPPNGGGGLASAGTNLGSLAGRHRSDKNSRPISNTTEVRLSSLARRWGGSRLVAIGQRQ
jgi:hypothetical protein